MKVKITSCPNYFRTMAFLKSAVDVTIEQCNEFAKGKPFIYEPASVSEVAFYLDLIATGATAEVDQVFNEAQIVEAITNANETMQVLAKRVVVGQNIIRLSKRGLPDGFKG